MNCRCGAVLGLKIGQTAMTTTHKTQKTWHLQKSLQTHLDPLPNALQLLNPSSCAPLEIYAFILHFLFTAQNMRADLSKNRRLKC